MVRGPVSRLVINLVLVSFSIVPMIGARADEVRPLAVGDVVTVLVRYDQREPATDDAEAQDAAVFRIAAVVTSVRANGNLELAAKREIRDGQQTWVRSLSGVVRPDVVDPIDRTVDSNEIAELRMEQHNVGESNHDAVERTANSVAASAHRPLKQYVVRLSLEEAGAVVNGAREPGKVLADPMIAVCENRLADFNCGGPCQVCNQNVPGGISLKLKVAPVDEDHARVTGVLDLSVVNNLADEIGVRESTAVYFDKNVKLGETIRKCVSKSENCPRYFQLTVDDVSINAQSSGAAEP